MSSNAGLLKNIECRAYVCQVVARGVHSCHFDIFDCRVSVCSGTSYVSFDGPKAGCLPGYHFPKNLQIFTDLEQRSVYVLLGQNYYNHGPSKMYDRPF